MTLGETVGPVRHRQLIRLLACAAAFDLVAGVIAVYERNGPRPTTRDARASRDAAAADAGPTAILAAGSFANRRGPRVTAPDRGGSTGAAAPTAPQGAAPSTRGAPDAPTVSATSPSHPDTSTTTERRTTPSTARPRPVTSPTGHQTTSTGVGTSNGAAPSQGGVPAASAPAGSGGSQGAPTGDGSDPRWLSVEDAAGDTTIDGSGKPKAERRTDIVQTQVTYQTAGIVLAARMAQPVDPSQDPNWASDSTFLSWELDTTGDMVPDFEIQFSFDGGAAHADVHRAGDAGGESLCTAEAGYVKESYAMGLAPTCLGSPAAFAYRVSMFYDTDPKNENADVITDVAPNGGFSRPVSRAAG